jgi:hypothetical protein
MPVDLDAPAGQLLAAELVAPPPPGRWATVRRFLGALVRVATADATDTLDHNDAAARRDLLVTRRDTGATVLRVEAGTADVETLQHVTIQLEELTVAEFLDRWGVGPSTLS